VLFGESAAAGVEQPFLFMSCELSASAEEELATASGTRRRHLAVAVGNERDVRRSLAAHGGYRMTVRGAGHMNFCDSALYTTLKRLTDAGPIDSGRAMSIINDYTLLFFNKHLNMNQEGLLGGLASRYPEVRFEVWPPPGR
jgi:hypothetical protein